jgi:tetratricopeptide (TPR) repeat protein
MAELNDPHPLAGFVEPQTPASASAVLQVNFNRAMTFSHQGNFADAERICGEILSQRPNHFAAVHLLGEIAFWTQQTERALELFGRAVALKPDFAEAHSDRGMALRRLKRFEEAVASYDEAIALKPDFAMAYNNRANALLDLNRSVDALSSCDKAIALNPGLVLAHYNRGNALQALKRPEEALASFERATALKPDFTEANWNKGLCLLQMGRFEQGLRLYEWRKWRTEPVATNTFPQPIWLGDQDIAGKTLFLWWEQGFGDTIQFCRYATLVEARGAKAIMSVQKPLLKLLKQISPTIAMIEPDDVPSEFDFHCPLLSLPLALGTTLATIPAQQQYLKADAELRVAWEARLPPKSKPRIGLVWSGRTGHKNDRNRSIELQQLLPILGINADWISLQNEIREKDLAVLRQVGGMTYFGDELKDFSDTAALLDLMDLVIAVDTSVAHLSGAMGKPVWILLPHNPDWRWLLDRSDSPWYPSARLFRQSQPTDWGGIIDQVGKELRPLIAAFPR